MPDILEDIFIKAVIDMEIPQTQLFDDLGFSKIDVFDRIITQRGSMGINLLNNNVTVPVNGQYDLSVSGNVTFPAAEELEVSLFVNDVQTGKINSVQGQGAGQPLVIASVSTVDLLAGDTLDIRAKNADIGSFTLTYNRLYLQIRKDS